MKKYCVLHLTLNLPGPLALSKIAGIGATVTKVEPPTGDPLEGYYPDLYRTLHHGQRILRLDLKEARQRSEVDSELRKSDLFVTSVRPSALKNLGLDAATLRESFPKLHVVTLQGYPTPDENLPAHDLTCQAEAGLLTPPTLPRALIADFAAAERVFSMCLLALLRSEKGETATHVTVSLSEMAEEFSLPVKVGMTGPKGPLGGALPHYNIYRCKDGWIALAALEPHFLKTVLSVFGLSQPDHAEFEKIFMTKSKSEWEKLAKERGIPMIGLS